MPAPLEELARIAPAVWPGPELRVQPGDLTQFAPGGMGLGGPFPIRPWDDPFGPSPGRFYGFENHDAHPLRGAPLQDPAGGTVYFDDDPTREDFEALLRMMGVRNLEKDYAAFAARAENPEEERCLMQLRVMGQSGLSVFGASVNAETKPFLEQPWPLGELLWRFLGHQQEMWGRSYSHQLSGTFGGDGDWAKESLCFGFMVENAWHGIYRIWSRAWLVTK